MLKRIIVKKIVLSLLAVATVLGTTLSLTYSCNKVNNSEKLTELGSLIARGKLLSEKDYTPASWVAFQNALKAALSVNANENASFEQLTAALDNLIT